MIIVKGNRLRVKSIVKITSILFYPGDGAYFYVCSDIVENELLTLKNWQALGPDEGNEWFISHQQGTQIPQELGDYLVEINKNE